MLWSQNLGGNLTPGPVVGTDGTIYMDSNSGVLYALDPGTGSTRWQLKASGPSLGGVDLSTSPLILPSGDLLWPGPGGVLDEVSPDGMVLWSHTFSANVLSPVLKGSTAYVVTSKGEVAAVTLSRAQPAVAWSVQTDKPSSGSPVIDGSGHVVTTAGRELVAVIDRGGSGAIAWTKTLKATVEVSASSDANGRLYVTDNGGTAYSFADTGKLLWSRKIGVESYSSSSVTKDGRLVIGDNSGHVNMADATTGATLIRYQASHQALWAAQAIDERGDIYVGTQSNAVVGFSPTGRTLFNVPVSGPIDGYPALTGSGMLIIGDQSGTVYAFGPGK